MGKLQLKNPDDVELDIGRARVCSFQHSRTETLPHELRLGAGKTTQIEERKDSAGTRSMIQEKDLDQMSLFSKYARVLCCSFERETGN